MARSDEITDNDLQKYLKTKEAQSVIWYLAIDKQSSVKGQITTDDIDPNEIERYFVLSMLDTTNKILYDHVTFDKIKSSFRERKNITKLAPYQSRIVYENVKSEIVKDFFAMKEGLKSADEFINKWFPEIYV